MNVDLEYKNFGIIENANVKIRPFTLIAGVNSSGKSFITKSLYSILSAVKDDSIIHFLNEFENKLISYDNFYSELEKKLIDEIIKDINYLKKIFSGNNDIDTLKVNFHEKISAIKGRIDQIATYDWNNNGIITLLYQDFKKYLERIHKVFSDLLSFDKDSIRDNQVNLLVDQVIDSLCKNFQATSIFELKNNKNINNESSINFKFDENNIYSLSFETHDENIKTIKNEISGSMILKYKELTNVLYIESPIYFKLIQQITQLRLSISNKNLINIPQYVLDMFDIIMTKHINTGKEYNISDINVDDFMRVIDGKLVVNQGAVGLSYQDSNGKNYALEQTAMGIINIGILKYLISNGHILKNTILILDEPEVNLHPKWQELLIDLLYTLTKNEVTVVLATHSPYIIRKIQDLIEQDNDSNHWGINFMCNGKNLTENTSTYESIKDVRENLEEPYMDIILG